MSVKRRIQPGDGDPRHGTANGYNNHDCRCQACRDAWAEYLRPRVLEIRRGYMEVGLTAQGKPRVMASWQWDNKQREESRRRRQAIPPELRPRPYSKTPRPQPNSGQ